MTALGPLDLCRSHGYCQACGQPGFAADDLLGIDGWMTARARRLACLAGLHDPFRKADDLLAELCGWRVCAETIRRHCHQGAADARACRDQRAGLPQEFAKQTHQNQDCEVHVDAGKVNTPEGWRDIKVASFACRERGQPSTSADYEQRDLPVPSVRAVVAEVEEAAAFGPRCQQEAERLGVSVAQTGLSVLGDGAEWIWNLAEQTFAGATQVLDVYHGVEKLAGAAREAFGCGTATLAQWLEQARGKLIGDGYAGVCEALAEPIEDAEAQGRLNGKAGEVLNYFCGHQGRLGYAVRLRRGQAIGSGLVEGTIKQRVNVRMKRGSARWLPKHVGAFVEFMALSDTPEWDEYWMLMAL
jgi:hypothetical protein